MKNKYLQNIIISVCLSALSTLTGLAQSDTILTSYINQGLSNNLALQQKQLNLEKSLLALKEANGLFYPSVNLDAQYILANGGRTIDLPLGDLFNPVYSSLNQILQNMGQPGNFPQLSNQQIDFLPNKYMDSKIRVIIPLVNAEIYYNHKIKKELINYSQAEVNVYKRELVKDIKTSYYRYLQSIKVNEAYRSALDLVKEAARVNEKLVLNQMAGKNQLLRIKAEQSQVEAQLFKAENDKKTAQSYINFLINRSLQSPVAIDSILLNEVTTTEQSKLSAEIPKREELEQLNSALKASSLAVSMKKSYLIPTISNITDLGYQGYLKDEKKYVMNVISLQWTIFNGFQKRRQISQARIDNSNLQKRLDETEQQIELQTQLAENNLESSIKSESANFNSLLSSKEYYKVTSKEYALGQKSLLDLFDARSELTKAQVGFNISHFETRIKQAELERAKAAYIFK
jgi:outer membrane protein